MDKENKQLVPWFFSAAFFGVAVFITFLWIDAADSLQKTESVLTSTQDDLREMARELDATKKELYACQAAPKPTEYVHTSGDRCGELLEECLKTTQGFLDTVNQHVKTVEAILR